MDLDDGITLRAADDPTIKNELRRAWIADRLDERLGEFGQTHAVDVVCATWNANGKDVTKLNLDLEPWLRSTQFGLQGHLRPHGVQGPVGRDGPAGRRPGGAGGADPRT